MILYTIGHGMLGTEPFAELLTLAGVSHLVDVRSVPKSRHNPQFGRTEMEGWLPDGISYRWDADLGGFRRAAKDSPNTGLRHPSFRGYADHMQTAAFHDAFDRLLAGSARSPTVIMCSESVWWRCHRRLIADAATLLGEVEVLHLMHDGTARPHQITPPAQVVDGDVTYPDEEEPGMRW